MWRTSADGRRRSSRVRLPLHTDLPYTCPHLKPLRTHSPRYDSNQKIGQQGVWDFLLWRGGPIAGDLGEVVGTLTAELERSRTRKVSADRLLEGLAENWQTVELSPWRATGKEAENREAKKATTVVQGRNATVSLLSAKRHCSVCLF